MEIIYASLTSRQSDDGARPGHEADVVDALWAHALPDDGLQHVSARREPGRVDLLLFLLTTDPFGGPGPLHRAHGLIARSHRLSPLLHRRYLPPELLTSAAAPTRP